MDEFGELQKLGGQLSFLDGFDSMCERTFDYESNTTFIVLAKFCKTGRSKNWRYLVPVWGESVLLPAISISWSPLTMMLIGACLNTYRWRRNSNNYLAERSISSPSGP